MYHRGSFVKFIDSGLFVEKVFGLLAVDSLAHLQRLYDVAEHLLLFMIVLPLFNFVVLAVDFLKVRVHLLIFLHCSDFFGFLLFLQRLLRQVVLHRDLASD